MTRDPSYAELEEVLVYARDYAAQCRSCHFHLAVLALDKLVAAVDRIDGRRPAPGAAVHG